MEIYIHIPFCVRKCNYCDFLSGPATKEMQDAYMEALCCELKERSKECEAYTISSVFIGGGTPSVVDVCWIEQVMDILHSVYHLEKDAEISIEMNPGTANLEYLRRYRKSGMNRLSIGLQSSNAEELKALGRIHTYEQFLTCFKQAREVGFTNINVDIMSALPKQSYASYQDTLQKVVGLAPEHISAYSLIIEEGTPFYECFEKGELMLPEEDVERKMYEYTGEYLQEHGYERYEISNYAQNGKECRHNVGYWIRDNYLGFGIGAASLVQNTRFRNSTDMRKYIENPCNVREDMEDLSKQEQMEETMFLGLRMTRGVSVKAFRDAYGISIEQVYGAVLQKHMQNGLVYQYEKEGEAYIALTPKGMDISNYVMSDFLEPEFF